MEIQLLKDTSPQDFLETQVIMGSQLLEDAQLLLGAQVRGEAQLSLKDKQSLSAASGE